MAPKSTILSRRSRLIGLLLTAAIALLLPASGASAADVGTLQAKVASARSQAEAISADLQASQAQMAAAQQQAAAAAAASSRSPRCSPPVSSAPPALATGVRRSQRQLAVEKRRLRRARAALARRLVAIYESGVPDSTELILSADGFDDLATRSDYLKMIENSDTSLAGAGPRGPQRRPPRARADRAAEGPRRRLQRPPRGGALADLGDPRPGGVDRRPVPGDRLLAGGDARHPEVEHRRLGRRHRGRRAAAAAQARRPPRPSRPPQPTTPRSQQSAQQEVDPLARRPLLDSLLHRRLRVRRQLRRRQPLERRRRRLPDPALDLGALRGQGQPPGRQQGRAGPDRRPDLGRLRLRRLGLRRLSGLLAPGPDLGPLKRLYGG